jgi:hypothetical protein
VNWMTDTVTTFQSKGRRKARATERGEERWSGPT